MADLVLGVAKSLVEGTLTKAQSAIDEESKLRQSAQRDLVFIAGEFQMMQSFLRVTTQEQVRNNVVSTWVIQIRDLAYDVEDCIEFIIHLDTKSDWWCRLIPPFMRRALPLDVAVNMIDQLKARVHDVSQRNERYKLISDPRPEPVMEGRQLGISVASGMLATARDTAWKQHEWDTLVKMITKKDLKLQVISVWTSVGNLGNASIIWKAYNQSEIRTKFKCRAWVKVLRPFQPNEFIRSLLGQFYTNSREEQQGNGVLAPALDDHLVEEFMERMKNQTYLIVLEDVFSTEEWDTIRRYLPDSSKGSRIVVSTQNFAVASFCTGYPCFQRFSADQSFCVFYREREDPPVGRTSEVNQLSAYLAKARVNALQVMSVWGIAGAGKSALVRNLYHNKMMSQNKEYRKYIWVDVYRPFNLIDFCKSLLMQFHSHSLKTDVDPVKQCHGLLKDHQCLLVIDNLHSIEQWDLIHDALAFRPSGSAIVVITNEERIALHCADRKDLVFNIKALEMGAAIDLFKEEVEGSQYLLADVIEKDSVLQQLITKSGGLPKVIVAIADYLAHIFDWVKRANILNDQFITTMETRQDFACLRDLFGWIHSYFRSCPDFLKPCIFYLSIFPKPKIIRRRRLVMRWVAEGYSKDNESDSAEENAEELFAKIIELSMIQPPEQTIITNRRMVWCQVSAFFHEYIISRPKEENVTFALEVFALKGCCRQTTGRTGRHLVIEKSWERDRIVFESIDLSRLRSLTVFGDWASFFISESMKVLRVLDLENALGVTDKDLQKMLKLLRFLKFLSLRGCSKISNLPSSVANLRQLQILDVRYTSIVNMPASITKLKKLQYIRAGTATPPDDRRCLQLVGVKVASGVKELTLVHTLGVVNVSAAGGKPILKELRNLTQLRKLGVSGISKKNGKEFCSAISGHSHLESLSVWLNKDSEGCLDSMCAEATNKTLEPPKKLRSLKLYGPVKKLPMWIKQLSNLRKLNLEMDILSEDDIRVLGSLQELCILRLHINPVHEGEVKFCVMQNGVEVRCYKEIKLLEIASRSRLNLIIGAEAMENLELLKAASCSAGSLPQFGALKHLKKLKKVHVIGSHDEEQKRNLENRFAEHSNKPALTLNPSAQTSTAGNDERCSFPFTPTSFSLATQRSCP
ncbi:unnamed protein product [Urochloa decumbens]|uniref:Disease resistance protein RPM1 n=1 Tax=Urochloa decumbens TaxID=240449 RepID=A0ABC9AXW7_9POAL